MNILSRVMSISLDNLKTAQRHFNANPNSTNWNVLTKAMLVYQQITQLSKPSNAESLTDLLARLDAMTASQWPETIVQHSLNMSIADALA
jgi:hypothetical protein